LHDRDVDVGDHPQRCPDGERCGLPEAAGDRDVRDSGEMAGNSFYVRLRFLPRGRRFRAALGVGVWPVESVGPVDGVARLRGEGIRLERGDGDNCPSWSGGQGQRFDRFLDHGPVKDSVSGRDLLGDPVGPGRDRGGVAAEAR
jgi:hypothetical protein